MSEIALQLSGIDKRFGDVYANQSIDLTVKTGHIHGIIGENGAGKSTLMSIIYGFYQADAGNIAIDGKPINITDSQTAIEAGIGMVHQHFMLVDNMTVLENIVLGAESSALLGEVKQTAAHKMRTLQERFGIELDLNATIESLPVGVQQRVEIAKALYRGAKILILDEPTGVLTPQEADQLFEVLKDLKSQGVTVLLITHKLREIMAITDEVSVMRGGKMVAHRETSATNPSELAELMVGRPVLLNVEKAPSQPSAVQLAVENLSLKDDRGVALLKSLNFELRAGEILGVAGVSGNGQSELLQVLAGTRRASAGTLQLGTQGQLENYSATTYPDAHQLRQINVAHVPEDRLGDGLVKTFSAAESAILGYQHESQFGEGSKLNPKQVHAHTADLMDNYDVRPRNPQIKAANMSGGNQQKLILAREMSRQPKVLLVGQPTRGVDIGAIENIYKALIEARDAGAAILLVSVELDEIMALSDRIAVMCAGEIVDIVDGATANANQLGLLMAGGEQ